VIKLSVLIPVFNEDIRPLAGDLQRLISDREDVEVIFGDDSSDMESIVKENEKFISKYERFRYTKRDQNLGYCENRNELGREANGQHLLFLDADVRIENSDFITNWLLEIPSGAIICGGNEYQSKPPEDSGQILKWKFGKEREEASAQERNRNPYLRFWASNFLVAKDLFTQIPFDRQSRQYGYNDTVYAYLLMKKGVAVRHIHNPVLNTGLIDKEKFLSRTKTAVSNLLFFEEQDYVEKDFGNYIKLLAFYYRLKRLGLIIPVYAYLKMRRKNLYRNLRSDKPSLRNLDLLKLYYLIQAKRL
jgi:glycosyltransferase involved in cell wall biosynthesis